MGIKQPYLTIVYTRSWGDEKRRKVGDRDINCMLYYYLKIYSCSASNIRMSDAYIYLISEGELKIGQGILGSLNLTEVRLFAGMGKRMIMTDR